MTARREQTVEPAYRGAGLHGKTRVCRSAWLERWHLLSLDAPCVSCAWAGLAARAAGVVLPGRELAALFLAVWVLYAADRLLDARLLGLQGSQAAARTDGLERRHFFHHEWRVGFRWGIGLACVALAALLPSLPGAEIERFGLLGALLVGWFVLIHTGTKPLPKEFVVGLFFAAAVFVPTVIRLPAFRGHLIFPALMVAAVCSLNCLFLFVWEHAGRADVVAHRGTRAAAAQVVPIAGALAFVCVLGTALPEPGRTILEACAVAVLLLLCLHGLKQRLNRTTLRALADVALLLPAIAGICLDTWLR